jgi:hypothetical protein
VHAGGPPQLRQAADQPLDVLGGVIIMSASSSTTTIMYDISVVYLQRKLKVGHQKAARIH